LICPSAWSAPWSVVGLYPYYTCVAEDLISETAGRRCLQLDIVYLPSTHYVLNFCC
jgi:hypothetical protein